MNKKIVIIGGGIIGLCSAYYLRKQGHQVMVIDKSNMLEGASYINAGYITPSHIIPLASPGMITKGLKWMFNSSSPFYVKPRIDIDFLKWGLAFKKSATKAKVNKAIPLIKDINLLSRDLYEDLKSSVDFHFERKGLLMLCKTEKALEEEWEIGKRAISQGLNVQELDKKQTQLYEPEIDLDIAGSIYFDCDAHMTPSEFMDKMKSLLKNQGVLLYSNEEVTDIKFTGNTIKELTTTKQTLHADKVVLAAGSWSPEIAKKLGFRIPIQAGKGYAINVVRETGIKMPAILVESKVAVTPMNGFTRFAGTMEIGGLNQKINATRVDAIANAVSQYYDGLAVSVQEKQTAKCGLRPCSPDGLPFIGRTSKFNNLVIATGHAMMGWSLGPATGKLVQEIIDEDKLSMPIDAFSPDRRF